MNKLVIGLKCTSCQRIFKPNETKTTCPYCKDEGILDVLYDYKTMKLFLNRESLSCDKELSMFRYKLLLPIDQKHIKDMLKIGWTPLYQIHRLHKEINIKTLYIKDDGLNPSGSLKDRASAIAVLRAIEENNPTVSCSSTGNAASSLACHAARMGLNSVIFVPKRAPIGKINQLSIYGANVIKVDGDYKDAYQLSKQAIDYYGWYNRNAAINPYLVEGKKTVALEIAEQLNFKLTDWVAVSVGDGCTIAGVYKGFYDLKKLGMIKKIPRLLGVQSTGCDPFVEAFKNHEPIKEANENTLADSISVGIPRNPIKALLAIEKSKGAMISIPDEDILKAMKLMGSSEGVFGEPAASAVLAGVIQAVKDLIIQPNESVVMINTGNGLKDPKNASLAAEEPILMKPSLKDLKQYMIQKGDKQHV